jgi:hypothetical protein
LNWEDEFRRMVNLDSFQTTFSGPTQPLFNRFNKV